MLNYPVLLMDDLFFTSWINNRTVYENFYVILKNGKDKFIELNVNVSDHGSQYYGIGNVTLCIPG